MRASDALATLRNAVPGETFSIHFYVDDWKVDAPPLTTVIVTSKTYYATAKTLGGAVADLLAQIKQSAHELLEEQIDEVERMGAT